ncbi:sigma factor-like helix-turn-helix DNA-binding protein [Cohnella sp. GCM10012308]|uniref:sigma factor-like helix-turn-helix DNA-binding protein n=1 Tax=Cohnella sp. GCM10012308 TaxID=3317329 RepID=UPI003620202E
MTLEYLRNRKKMTAYQHRLTATDGADPSEVTRVNSMVAEMAWVIEWLRTGRQPGLSRGVDRHGAYRSNRHIILDEDLFPSLQEPPRANVSLTEEQRLEALAAIRLLSPRELQCLLMHKVQGEGPSQIASRLRISVNTVKSSLRRAKQKIPGAQ